MQQLKYKELVFIGVSTKQPPATEEGLHLSRDWDPVNVETAEWRQSLSKSDKGG